MTIDNGDHEALRQEIKSLNIDVSSRLDSLDKRTARVEAYVPLLEAMAENVAFIARFFRYTASGGKWIGIVGSATGALVGTAVALRMVL